MSNLPLTINSDIYERLNDIRDLKELSRIARDRSLSAEEKARLAEIASNLTREQVKAALAEGDQLEEVKMLRVDPETQETLPTAADMIQKMQGRNTAQLAQTAEEVFKLETKTEGEVSIDEFKDLVKVRNVAGRSAMSVDPDDWTAALKAGVEKAAEEGKTLKLSPRRYYVLDNLSAAFGAYKCHFKGTMGATVMEFINSTEDKALLDLTPDSSQSSFEGITFVDSTENRRTSVGVRISAYPKPEIGAPNWKNYFVRCEFVGFKLATHFATKGNPLIGREQDWASETLFLHCKFKNNKLGVLNQNLQAVNNTFIQCDFENDDVNEQYTHVRDESGGGLNFTECSIIGRGRWFEWAVPQGSQGLFPNAMLNIDNCRFELRQGHIGEVFYQDPAGNYNIFSSMSINMTNCGFILYGQKIDLIKYTGRVEAKFNDLKIIDGTLVVRNYPVEGKSATVPNGSIGEVRVTRSSNVTYEIGLTNLYGSFNRRFAGRVVIDDSYQDAAAAMSTDSYGFKKARGEEINIMPVGLNTSSPKRLVWNDPMETAGFSEVKAILPKYASALSLGAFKQPNRFNTTLTVELYYVKDVWDWQSSTFNLSQDSYKIATLSMEAGKAGHFQVPIQLPFNVLGNRMTVTSSANWQEGRILIRVVGPENLGGFVYVEYM